MSLFLAGNDSMPPRLCEDFKTAKRRAVSIVRQQAQNGFEGGFNFTIYEVEVGKDEPLSQKDYIGCVEQQPSDEEEGEMKAILFVQEYEVYEKPILKNAQVV